MNVVLGGFCHGRSAHRRNRDLIGTIDEDSKLRKKGKKKKEGEKRKEKGRR
jgi:hypothetical protein